MLSKIITPICFENTLLRLRHIYAVAVKKSECSLNNKCLSESLVYEAAVSQTPSQVNKYYYGTCEKTFKERYKNHTATFRNKNKTHLGTKRKQHPAPSQLAYSFKSLTLQWLHKKMRSVSDREI